MSMFGNRQAAPNTPAPAPAPSGGLAASQAAARPAPAGPPRSKYGGISCAETRDPMLGPGTYRVRVDACAEGYNPGKRRESFKSTLRVLECLPGSETAPGATVGMVNLLHTPAGISELKRFFMHAAGFGPTLEDRAKGNAKQLLLDGEDAYNRFDETFGYQGAVIEASAGQVKSNAPSIVGRIVDVEVKRGKDIVNTQTNAATGDYYRIYTWGVVPEADQTVK